MREKKTQQLERREREWRAWQWAISRMGVLSLLEYLPNDVVWQVAAPMLRLKVTRVVELKPKEAKSGQPLTRSEVCFMRHDALERMLLEAHPRAGPGVTCSLRFVRWLGPDNCWFHLDEPCQLARCLKACPRQFTAVFRYGHACAPIPNYLLDNFDKVT